MEEEYRAEIARIIGDTELARQVLDVIRRSEQARKAALVQRQAEGIAAARSKGVAFGRPKKPLDPELAYYYWAVRRGDMTLAAVARELNLSRGKLVYQMGRYAEEHALPPPRAAGAFAEQSIPVGGGAARELHY